MRRYLAVGLVLTGTFLCAALFPSTLKSVAAQGNQNSAPVRPNAGGTIGGPNANVPATPPTLQCQGCHAPGKTLPYLAGSLFHTEAHAAYDRGFHSQSIHNGAKGATCLDCHTKNGDLTTILPAGDPKSTIYRANLAQTCGCCHGDKSMMQGSGISDRPFLSYRESVHAKAMARGNTSAAVCSDCHNSHDILPASNAQSTIAKVNIPATCGKCHATESAEFIQSIHGQAVTRGVLARRFARIATAFTTSKHPLIRQPRRRRPQSLLRAAPIAMKEWP